MYTSTLTFIPELSFLGCWDWEGPSVCSFPVVLGCRLPACGHMWSSAPSSAALILAVNVPYMNTWRMILPRWAGGDSVCLISVSCGCVCVRNKDDQRSVQLQNSPLHLLADNPDWRDAQALSSTASFTSSQWKSTFTNTTTDIISIDNNITDNIRLDKQTPGWTVI